jgi:hypothetical protein
MSGDRLEHGETLRRYGQVMLAKGGFRVAHLPFYQGCVLDFVK